MSISFNDKQILYFFLFFCTNSYTNNHYQTWLFEYFCWMKYVHFTGYNAFILTEESGSE